LFDNGTNHSDDDEVDHDALQLPRQVCWSCAKNECYGVHTS
jgi:hypothetical protein